MPTASPGQRPRVLLNAGGLPHAEPEGLRPKQVLEITASQGWVGGCACVATGNAVATSPAARGEAGPWCLRKGRMMARPSATVRLYRGLRPGHPGHAVGVRRRPSAGRDDPAAASVERREVDSLAEDRASVDDLVLVAEHSVDRVTALDGVDAVDEVGQVSWVGLPGSDRRFHQRDELSPEPAVLGRVERRDATAGVLRISQAAPAPPRPPGRVRASHGWRWSGEALGVRGDPGEYLLDDAGCRVLGLPFEDREGPGRLGGRLRRVERGPVGVGSAVERLEGGLVGVESGRAAPRAASGLSPCSRSGLSPCFSMSGDWVVQGWWSRGPLGRLLGICGLVDEARPAEQDAPLLVRLFPTNAAKKAVYGRPETVPMDKAPSLPPNVHASRCHMTAPSSCTRTSTESSLVSRLGSHKLRSVVMARLPHRRGDCLLAYRRGFAHPWLLSPSRDSRSTDLSRRGSLPTAPTCATSACRGGDPSPWDTAWDTDRVRAGRRVRHGRRVRDRRWWERWGIDLQPRNA